MSDPRRVAPDKLRTLSLPSPEGRGFLLPAVLSQALPLTGYNILGLTRV
jgi:hypothetical protein